MLPDGKRTLSNILLAPAHALTRTQRFLRRRTLSPQNSSPGFCPGDSAANVAQTRLVSPVAGEGPSLPGTSSAPRSDRGRNSRAGSGNTPPFSLFFLVLNQYLNFTKSPSAALGARNEKDLRRFVAAQSEAVPKRDCLSVAPYPVSTCTRLTGTVPATPEEPGRSGEAPKERRNPACRGRRGGAEGTGSLCGVGAAQLRGHLAAEHGGHSRRSGCRRGRDRSAEGGGRAIPGLSPT